MPEPGNMATAPTQPAASAPAPGKLRSWLWGIRANSRLAFLLQLAARVLTSGLNLIWIRLLVGAMGKPLNGLYLAFQSVFSLGGLGDLGMGGAVGIRAGQYLGQGKENEPELQRFLASARAVFLFLTIALVGVMLLFAHWIPHWLNFPSVPEAGSLTKVFAVGAAIVGGVLLFSYISNVNYACGNVGWPVLPDFLLLQASLLCHWLLARQGQPLWVQFLPYLASAAVKLWLMWIYVRASHPPLSHLLPLRIDWRLAVNLFEGSVWFYLCSLGNAIYRNTDALVINAGFAPGTLPDYIYNYKFCELMYFVVNAACFVILPKMTQWMASPNTEDQQRARVEMRRLNQFQALLGCGAALAYLAFNSLFMTIWWMHKANPILPAALLLQLAFALNLAVTSSGDAALQLSTRAGEKGLRVIGVVSAITGLVNLGLSIFAMRRGSLAGIAMATVLAQSLAMLASSFYLCRHLKIEWLPWAFKGCILPLALIGLAGWLRMTWPMDSISHTAMLVGAYGGMFLLAAWVLGVDWAMIQEEFNIIRKIVKR